MTFRFALSGAQQAKLLLVAAVTVGVLSTVAGRGTVAYFTTQVSSTANTFTAGTLHLEVADNDDAATRTSVGSSITFSNMKPGDVVYAPIELDNTGSLDLVYGIKYVTTSGHAGADQDLADVLTLAVLGTGATGSGTTADAAADAAHACSAANFATPGTIWPAVVRASALMT